MLITGTICFCTLNATDPKAKTGIQKLGRDSIPKPVGYVNDFENLLTPIQEKVLDSIIRAYEKQTSIEIAVLTFDTTLIGREGLEKFALNVLNTWGIGKKEKNNGILMAISSGYRLIRIENGYGIEKIMTDEETKQIIETNILPSFKERKYYEGMLNGVNTLISTLNRKMKLR